MARDDLAPLALITRTIRASRAARRSGSFPTASVVRRRAHRSIMTEAEFRALAAQGYNRIPLVLESFADLDTPLSLYVKLANAPPRFCSNRW
jgi:hypothetical protein